MTFARNVKYNLRVRNFKDFEKQFFRCAGLMLACNLRAMGGIVPEILGDDFEGQLQGMQDWAQEMKWLCRKRLQP